MYSNAICNWDKEDVDFVNNCQGAYFIVPPEHGALGKP